LVNRRRDLLSRTDEEDPASVPPIPPMARFSYPFLFEAHCPQMREHESVHTASQRQNDADRSRSGATDWKPIKTAPFDRDLELAVLGYDGAHALVFPCRRILCGWIDAATKRPVQVNPSHWREWDRGD
jgi:hypothetical protein